MLNEIPDEWKLYSGKIDYEKCTFGPTIVAVPAEEVQKYLASNEIRFKLLKTEIFGPILPVLEVVNIEEATRIANLIDP